MHVAGDTWVPGIPETLMVQHLQRISMGNSGTKFHSGHIITMYMKLVKMSKPSYSPDRPHHGFKRDADGCCCCNVGIAGRYSIRLFGPHVYRYHLCFDQQSPHAGHQSSNRCGSHSAADTEYCAHGREHHPCRRWTGEVSRHVSRRAIGILPRRFPRHICDQACVLCYADYTCGWGGDLSLLRRLAICMGYHRTMHAVVQRCSDRCSCGLQLFASQ